MAAVGANWDKSYLGTITKIRGDHPKQKEDEQKPVMTKKCFSE